MVKYWFKRKKMIFQIQRNNHEDRNILRFSENGMYQDMIPDKSSEKIKELLKLEPQCVYAGFDPTAGSLHLGNLLVLKNLLLWQRAGHKVIVLIGIATAQVGDPSGCFVSREEQNVDIVKERGYHIQKNIQTVFDNHERYFWNQLNSASPLIPVKFVNNNEWYDVINLIEFMNNVSRYFNVSSMLSEKNTKKRISSSQGMSCTEFLYQMFQAYDWYYLYKTHDCKFQIGGEDQLINMKAGNKLIRLLLNESSYGLTLPLLSNKSGKLGKSEMNAVWLDPLLTSPFNFYQTFIRLPDIQAVKLFKLFSFKPFQDIQSVVTEHLKAPENRLVHMKLAEEVTLLVHGEEGLDSAKKTTQLIFSNDIEYLSKLNAEDLVKALPGCTVIERKFETGCTVLNFLLDLRCFFYESVAVGAITSGGVYVNMKKVTNVNETLSYSDHVLQNNITVIRIGKKQYYIIKWFF